MVRRNTSQMLATIRHTIDVLAQTVETLGGNLQREISQVRSDTERQRCELAAESTTAFSELRAQNRELREALRAAQHDVAATRSELQALRADTETVRREAAEARAAERAAATDGASTCTPLPPSALSGEGGSSGGECSEDFGSLLGLAAGIAYAELVCHRDTWAFIVEQAIGGEHFRLPADIEERDDGTMDVDISGRNLIAVIEALWDVQRRSGTSAGTCNLARQTYGRIEDALKRVHAEGCGDGGTVPRIVIDDRHPCVPQEDGPDDEAVPPSGEPDDAE